MKMMNWSPGLEKVVITTSSRESLMRDISAHVTARRGFTVATLNLDHVVKLRRDAAFRRAYGRHSHVVADGNPIVWLARLARQDVSLVPGSELVDPVAAIAARERVPVALVGARDDTLARAAGSLTARHPGLEIVARISPSMGFDPAGAEAESVMDAIASSGAGLCFLALGAPRQEIFAARAARRFPQMGFLSIGAGLDFVAGSQTRAPSWIRALAAEWLWRLGSDPRRLAGRYAACIAVLPGLVEAALRTRSAIAPDAASTGSGRG